MTTAAQPDRSFVPSLSLGATAHRPDKAASRPKVQSKGTAQADADMLEDNNSNALAKPTGASSASKPGGHVKPAPHLSCRPSPKSGLGPSFAGRLAPAFNRAKIDTVQALASFRAKIHQVVQSPQWARLGQTALYATGALALSVSVGLLCALTITPWFLALTLPASNAAAMMTQLPFVGTILTGITQRGGPFGALCSSAVLWFSTKAMFSSGTVKDRQRDWALAAVAVGFALSPVFVPAVPVTGALAAACLLGTLALGALTSQALLPLGNTDWRVNLMAIAIGVAFAPMGGQAAMLVPQVAILGEALTIITLCTLGIAVHSVFNLVAPLFRENAAAAQDADNVDKNLLVLNRAGPKATPVPNATVFGVEDVPGLCGFIHLAKKDADEGKTEATRFVVLRGPLGSGKWSIAAGMAASIGIPIERPDRERLRQQGSAPSALSKFFSKCIERARVTQKPVAIMLKDIDTLLDVRGRGDAENDQMVAAALKVLEQLHGSKKSNLLIVATIAGDKPLDGAIRSRQYREFQVPRPSAQTLGAILENLLRSKIKEHRLVRPTLTSLLPECAMPANFAQEAGQAGYQRGLSGRDMAIYASRLADCLRLNAESLTMPWADAELPAAVARAHETTWREFVAEREAHLAPDTSRQSDRASSFCEHTLPEPIPVTPGEPAAANDNSEQALS